MVPSLMICGYFTPKFIQIIECKPFSLLMIRIIYGSVKNPCLVRLVINSDSLILRQRDLSLSAALTAQLYRMVNHYHYNFSLITLVPQWAPPKYI